MQEDILYALYWRQGISADRWRIEFVCRHYTKSKSQGYYATQAKTGIVSFVIDLTWHQVVFEKPHLTFARNDTPRCLGNYKALWLVYKGNYLPYPAEAF